MVLLFKPASFGLTWGLTNNRIFKKKKKKKVKPYFKDNIWSDNLTDIQFISKFNKVYQFSLCAIDIYSKYGWVVPLKDQ